MKVFRKINFVVLLFFSLSLSSCGLLVGYDFGSRPGVAFEDSRSDDDSTGVFNSPAGRLESEDICFNNKNCVELCDSMLNRFSDQKECYDHTEKEVQSFRDVYNLLAIGNPRKLERVDTSEMEEFLVFGPALWTDAIYGFERGRKEDCIRNSGDQDPTNREDCRFDTYYKQDGYWSDGAAATLEWISRNNWLAKLITENDKKQTIMKALLDILAHGGGKSLSDEIDHEPSDRHTNICNLELYEQDVDEDNNCDTESEDLDEDRKLDCGEDLNCDGDCEDSDENDVDGDDTCDRTEDLDGDGRLDVAEDIDGDGNLDVAEDTDGDGNLDVAEDVDGDGNLDVDEDANNNGTLDTGEDVDGDGNLDVAEDTDGDGNLDVAEDTDGDGNLDVAEDTDGDGNLDVNEDIDGDGHFDNTMEDADGDGKLDLVAEDIDGDGNLDVDEDIDEDGHFDNTMEDTDGDSFLDVFIEDLNGDGICNTDGHGRLYPESRSNISLKLEDHYKAFGADCVSDPRVNYFILSVQEDNENSVALGHEVLEDLCGGQKYCINYFYCHILGGQPVNKEQRGSTVIDYLPEVGINGYNNCGGF